MSVTLQIFKIPWVFHLFSYFHISNLHGSLTHVTISCVSSLSLVQLCDLVASSTAYSDNGETLFKLSGQNRFQLPYLHSHLSSGHTEPLEIWSLLGCKSSLCVFPLQRRWLLIYGPLPYDQHNMWASPLHTCFSFWVSDFPPFLWFVPQLHFPGMYREFWSYLLLLGFLQGLLWHKKT